MAEAAAGGWPRLPEDIVFWEILTRLPAKPLLRFRAVCRSWCRRLTSDAKLLLAHHRRQPSFPLVTSGARCNKESRIDALDHRSGALRPIVRTADWIVASPSEEDLHVFCSCDGLLILFANGCLQICNPATRQRAPLTLLQGAACISALYRHRPSGSYRVLCCFRRDEDGHAVYHVYTVGSGELRCVGEPPGPWASGDLVMAMPMMESFNPHVVADGRVYWQPIKLPGGNGKVNNMLVFDTVTESFQHMLSPVEGAFLEPFEMNNGALGLYDYRRRSGTADLWVLQDHKNWTWSLKKRIKLQKLVHSLRPVMDPEGDVLTLSNRAESLVLGQHLQHISGANDSSLARYEWNHFRKLSRHRFKESLFRHDFFSMEGNAGGVDGRPLFDGLSTVAFLRNANSEPHWE